MVSPESTNWVFDSSLTVDDIGVVSGDFSVDGVELFWAPQEGINYSSVENTAAMVDSAGHQECNYKKRVRSECSNVPGSKACREKMRRDQLNNRFLELCSVLEPGKPPKMDKTTILRDAIREVNQLRAEVEKLKNSKEILHEKIKELKIEKNELRDEKQALKLEKEKLELQVKMLNAQPSFMPQPPLLPTSFSSVQAQAAGRKIMMPVLGYPGYPMWQLMPPADTDTSQDAESCPPVA